MSEQKDEREKRTIPDFPTPFLKKIDIATDKLRKSVWLKRSCGITGL